MRFSYDLHLSTAELDSVRDIERNCGKHISLVNDIFSYEKEKLISEKETTEGAIMCNAVQILSDEVHISIEAAKNVLWLMVREAEFAHAELQARHYSLLPGLVPKDDLRRYIEGLVYQMSGNELWSRTTMRYRQPATVERKDLQQASSSPTDQQTEIPVHYMESWHGSTKHVAV